MFRKYRYEILIANLIMLFLSVFVTTAQESVSVNIKNYPNGTVLKLFAGQTLEAKLTPSNVDLDCADKDICKATKKNEQGEWTIEVLETLPIGKNTTDIIVTPAKTLVDAASSDSVPVSNLIIANGVDGKIPVKVYKIPDSANIQELKYKEPQRLDRLLGLDTETIENNLIIRFSSEIERSANTFKGIKQGAANLFISPKIGNFKSDKKFDFKVVPADRTLRILDREKTYKGSVNDTITTLKATVIDGNNVTLNGEIGKIVWEVRDPLDNDKVYLRQPGDGTVEVDLLEASDKPVYLVAKLEAADGYEEMKDQIAIFIKGAQSIIGFDTIEMRLNLMDERTAKDLFGGVAVDDYMIAKLRVFNKVPEDRNGGPSSSILFFSEGLEVNVSLQKRSQEKKRPQVKSKDDKDDEWKEFDQDDVEYVNNWVYVPEIDEKLIKYFITRDETSCSEQIQRLTSKKCEISTFEMDRLWYFYEKNECDNSNPQSAKNKHVSEERCAMLAKKNWIPFRPYAFLVIAGTHERRSERSTRERILKTAQSLSSLASFATAFARPANNSGFVFGLDKYSNLLIPSFEKLFPSRREVQRKNILDMALQPIEEVPFGKEVNKVVFIPKQPIEGVLPGYDVRISTVSVSKIKAEASVLNKQKVETR